MKDDIVAKVFKVLLTSKSMLRAVLILEASPGSVFS